MKLPKLFDEKIDPQFDLSSEIARPEVVKVPLEVLTPEWRAFCEREKVQPHIVIMYKNFTGTGKIWAVNGIFGHALTRGDHGNATEQQDSTSGNLGNSAALYVRRSRLRSSAYPITRSYAVVPKSLPEGKKARMRADGAEVIEIAGNSIEAILFAEKDAAEHGRWYSHQYQNIDNASGFLIPAQTIAEALPYLGLMACGIGSAGTCTGIMTYLTAAFEGRADIAFHRAAVIVENGEHVGGVTSEETLYTRTQPWWEVVDDTRIVGEDRSYKLSSALWRLGDDTMESDAYPVGPSTGFALEGALLAARDLSSRHLLDAHRAPDGFAHIAAPAMDMRMRYKLEYEQKGVLNLSADKWIEPAFD